jgi:hypothetical protein
MTACARCGRPEFPHNTPHAYQPAPTPTEHREGRPCICGCGYTVCEACLVQWPCRFAPTPTADTGCCGCNCGCVSPNECGICCDCGCDICHEPAAPSLGERDDDLGKRIVRAKGTAHVTVAVLLDDLANALDAAEERARTAEAEAERLRDDYDKACVLVADMHAAAMGEVTGPVLGVVEDVADLRRQVDERTYEEKRAAENRENCEHCGTTDARCTKRVLSRGRACCGYCSSTDTHPFAAPEGTP